jgi:hypothetical protein
LRRLDQDDFDRLRARRLCLACDLPAHAETESSELDRRERDGDQKSDQQETPVARRWLPAQAPLPGQPIARKAQAARLVERRTGRGGDARRHGRWSLLALWDHE